MMGIYTDKTSINAFEDNYWNDNYKTPLKKASGDGLSLEDVENVVLRNIYENY